MPRNSSGVYSLPAGNPVVAATTIDTTWGNGIGNELVAEITDSLSRNGKGGMQAQLSMADGTSSTPGISWASKNNTGWYYHSATNQMRMTISGVDAFATDTGASTMTFLQPVTFSSSTTFSSTSNVFTQAASVISSTGTATLTVEHSNAGQALIVLDGEAATDPSKITFEDNGVLAGNLFVTASGNVRMDCWNGATEYGHIRLHGAGSGSPGGIVINSNLNQDIAINPNGTGKATVTGVNIGKLVATPSVAWGTAIIGAGSFLTPSAVTITGAVVGDLVSVSWPSSVSSTNRASLVLTATVTSADTVAVLVVNASATPIPMFGTIAMLVQVFKA